MKNKLAAIILVVILTGCGTFKPALPPLKEQINIDTRLLQPCENLIEYTQKTWEHVEEVNSINSETYKKCSLKVDSQIRLLKKIANKE